MSQQLNQVRAKLCSRSVVNELNGARYQDDDLAIMDVQFDLIWEEAYGYHPKNLPDYWS